MAVSLPIEEAQTLPSPAGKFPPKQDTTSQEPILIRPSRLFEGHHVGRIAAKTYYNTPLTRFLAPHREKYYADYEWGFSNRAQARLFTPRNVTFFAYEKSRPEWPIGYVQFVRLGDDEAARKMDRDAGLVWRLWLWACSWGWWTYTKVVALLYGGVRGDRSADANADAAFGRMVVEETKANWEGKPEMKNRWHAQSVVVCEEFQGRGIGKRLMAEVLERADSEGVIVGLEASAAGESMYRSVGFELLARFSGENTFEGRAGGVMMRKPRTWKEREVVVDK